MTLSRLTLLCTLIIVFFTLKSDAQFESSDPDKTQVIEKRIENIAEEQDNEEIDFTTVFDDLSYYYDHPLNLNRASREELLSLYLLTDLQANNLLLHIEKHGKLLTFYELQSIDGFDITTIYNIQPFTKVTGDLDQPNLTFKNIFSNGNSELFLRYIRVFEEMKGFSPIDDSTLAASPNKRYLGSPDRLYARYRFKYSNRISFGVTGDKDAGEEFFTNGNKQGFDFYSAHFYIHKINVIKHLAVGDYQLQFGQGLTFWSGIGFGKTADALNVKRNAQTVRPYTSVDENNFMRGTATTVEVGDFELTGFVSHKQIDANISNNDTLENEQEIVVTSFQTSGFHRTPNELEDKDAINETIYGGHAAYKTNRVEIGVTTVQSAWDADLQRSLQLYNQFEFNGNSNTNFGLDYAFIFQNINFFGEVGISANGGKAILNGAMINLSNNLALSILHRSYDRNYQSIYSMGFAESSRSVNEQGLYFGLEAKPAKHITLTAYYDRFKFPWLKYQIDAPSDGYDYLGQVTYQPSKKIQFYARFRQEIKPRNANQNLEKIDLIVNTNKKSLRFNTTYNVSDALKMRSRLELSWFKFGEEPEEQGYMIYQDFIYRPLSKPYGVTVRLALFDTDSYNSRIYAYENEILYYFSVPAYSNRGSRAYLLLKYKITRSVDLWVKLAQTYYSNLTEISSGLNQINGNTRTDIKAQIRIKF